MNRRDDHTLELLHRFAYRTLLQSTLGQAESMGFAPYDLKLVHDHLVSIGYAPIPHYSDAAYNAAMESRINKALSKATGLPPERIHTDRHPLDMD